MDFQITIPKILYLRVGTGSSYTTGVLTSVGTVDLVQFAPAAAVVGNGTAVAGTGGDLTNGVETAAIVSNSGNVTLNATAGGALSDGAGDSIPFTQITTTASTLNSATALPAPVLANGTSANVVLIAPATKIIQQDAKWTYAYANTTAPPAGTYGGVNVQQRPRDLHGDDAVTFVGYRNRCTMASRGRDMRKRPGGPDFLRLSRRTDRVAALAVLLLAGSCGPARCVHRHPSRPALPRPSTCRSASAASPGYYNAGGTPGNNATINKESVTVAANAVSATAPRRR